MRFVRLFSIAICLGFFLSSCTKQNDEAKCPDGPSSFQVGSGKIYVPNIVTDNSDGINDIFLPLVGPNIASIEDFKIVVEGKVLYEVEEMSLNDPRDGWAPVRQSGYVGRFVYAFVATSTDGTRETIIGNSYSFSYRPDSPLSLDCSKCRFATQHDGQGDFCESCPSYEDNMCE